MRQRFIPFHLSVCLLGWCLAIATPALAIQSGQQTILIPPLANATIDSQESDSIEFVLPAGKGKAAVSDWLTKFRQAGWAVEVVDQDSMFAEYELTRNGQTLEIELDDPGIDEADISISCDSEFRLAIEGAPPVQPAMPATGPTRAPAVFTAPDQSNARDGETSLGSVANLDWEIEKDVTPHWWISPNGKRFAWGKHTDSGMTIAVDGSELGMWDEIVSDLVFSPDSQHHVFLARHNHQGKLWHYLVVDGVPGKAYENLSEEFSFTADSTQVIFGHTKAGGVSVLIRSVDPSRADIETGHRFAAPKNVFFRGVNQVGYVATFSDREDAVFFNGKQIGQRYSDIDPDQIAVSADGQHVAFFAELSPVRLGLVLDGKLIREHNQFEQGTIIDNLLTLSPNGKRAAWGSRLNGQEFMVVDGKPGAGYGKVEFPEFSPDGNRFVYLAFKDGSPLFVIDGAESEKYANLSEPEFSKNGHTLAYYAELNQREFVVVNGKRQKEFERVTTPLLNQDGTILAYAATEGEHDFMIVNGAVKAKHSTVGSPFFIPQTNQLAWLVYDEGKGWRMVVEGVEKFAFEDFVGAPIFSPDGQHIVIAAVGKTGMSLMINGKPGAVHERILTQEGRTPACFDNAGNCNYLAVRNEELFLVTIKL